MKPGARAWVDGPHGVFTIDREEGAGYGLIGGGVGITPLRAMVLALEERGDVRPVVLFYGVTSEADLTYEEELAELDRRMDNLTVVRVLSKPGDDWAGRTWLHQRGHPASGTCRSASSRASSTSSAGRTRSWTRWRRRCRRSASRATACTPNASTWSEVMR